MILIITIAVIWQQALSVISLCGIQACPISFFQDEMLFSVKVYDLLFQKSDASKSITDEYIRDEKNNVLTRYVIFSLTDNLNKFGGKLNKGERAARTSSL